MNHKRGPIAVYAVLLLLLACILASPTLAMEAGPEGARAGPQQAASQPSAPDSGEDTYNTVITVTSGTDPDDSKSKRCSTEAVCTLRRAIVESRGLAPAQLPALIEFDIPATPAEGYNSSLGVWEIQIYNTTDLLAFRRLKGQVTIDGSTQPGGRMDGPKIILIGPGTGQKTGLLVGDVAGDDEIVIRGLGMQNFNPHIMINHDRNIVEDCWFGLSSDGTTLSSGSDTQPEGGSGVAMLESADDNIIRNNTFAGFNGVAAAIRGKRNAFTGNWVGMRADGTVPIPHQFDKHPCTGATWTGGTGITVSGDNHRIGGPNEADGNRFAGLYLRIFDESEQPFAIESSGTDDDNLIQNNIIGLDASGQTVGICGRGIKLSGGPKGTEVISNTIVEPGLSAILMNDSVIVDRLNGNTLRGNVIRRDSDWPEEQGDNKFPEAAIAYGAGVPEPLRTFTPARITQINGTSVSGTSGAGSPCPYCMVELFLDDRDTVVEALQSLAVVTADAHGNWAATLPAPLGDDQALRTMSTVPDDWTIAGLDAGTTSNLSLLYREGYQVFLPLVLRGF